MGYGEAGGDDPTSRCRRSFHEAPIEAREPTTVGKDLPMNLYWVETADGAEDWFVVAPSARRATRWHERAEGYDRGDAFATLVLRIPSALEAPEGWPSHELLLSCGARFRRAETPRVVEIDGRPFIEGYLEAEVRLRADDQFEALDRGRPNETKRRSLQ